MEKQKLKDVRARKSGTDYLVIKLPKIILDELPDPCYLDIKIIAARSGTSEKIKNFRRKR
jgi:hypothetical protein